MVLKLDGNSKIGSHVLSKIVNLICSGQLFKLRVANFEEKNNNKLSSFTFAQRALSYHLIYISTLRCAAKLELSDSGVGTICAFLTSLLPAFLFADV